MEPGFREEAHEEPLLADFDQLARRFDELLATLLRLSGERDDLAARLERLCGEAGVKNGDGLTGVIARWKTLEQENRTLQREREAIAKRLSALLEKVDLLQQGS
jgi:chromosome segregation ATPase